jgi:hypothetical protein
VFEPVDAIETYHASLVHFYLLHLPAAVCKVLTPRVSIQHNLKTRLTSVLFSG